MGDLAGDVGRQLLEPLPVFDDQIRICCPQIAKVGHDWCAPGKTKPRSGLGLGTGFRADDWGAALYEKSARSLHALDACAPAYGRDE